MPRKNRRSDLPVRAIRFIPLSRHVKPAAKKRNAEAVRLVPAKPSDGPGNLAA